MAEVLRPDAEVNYPPKTMAQVFEHYEELFDAAIKGSDEDSETDFDIRVARDTLVSEGLAVAQTVEDCRRISMKLGLNEEGLEKKVQHRSDFLSVINRFDKKHKAILTRVPSLDEDIEGIESDHLRFEELPKALEIADSKIECSEILGRIPERQTSLRDLVTRKMATF